MTDEELAALICATLEADETDLGPYVRVLGDFGRVIIDGSFDMLALSRTIRAAIEEAAA